LWCVSLYNAVFHGRRPDSRVDIPITNRHDLGGHGTYEWDHLLLRGHLHSEQRAGLREHLERRATTAPLRDGSPSCDNLPAASISPLRSDLFHGRHDGALGFWPLQCSEGDGPRRRADTIDPAVAEFG